MTCKECNFFVQGKGKIGTCEKRPYITMNGGSRKRRVQVQMIDGKPRTLYLNWSHSACSLFERKEQP